MFTGLITDIGTVTRITSQGSGQTLTIKTSYQTNSLELGESIACNGVCLTVTAIDTDAFSVDISAETISRSTFKSIRVGDRLHLERALRVGDRLGGHYVSGHVDVVGRVERIDRDGKSWLIRIAAPRTLAPLLVTKGSIAVDGVSLTLNSVTDFQDRVTFELTIIPFTGVKTRFSDFKVGTEVNLEGDIFGKYVLRAQEIAGSNSSGDEGEGGSKKGESLTFEKLADFGFS